MVSRKRVKNFQLGITRPICKKKTLKNIEKSLRKISESQERINQLISLLPLQCVIQCMWPIRILGISSKIVQCALSMIPFIKNYFT
ncbi:Hypothetical protein SRAE_2000256450 [Strongyloides ratti]|uniref:Uncharacterized protein n=1 Tax=Strongyloides ratti TaxID=34506 RepID=A0A090LID1_STRRB|nr:Hypothetical protein SRAE_2000256450 [Strongyloides ratti]CEF67903.1 Hypothetical protein SRAE_2000256450 [Strongyloides ratti]